MKWAFVLSLASLAAAVPVPAVEIVYVTTYTTVYGQEPTTSSSVVSSSVAPTSTATPTTSATITTTPTTIDTPTTTVAPSTTSIDTPTTTTTSSSAAPSSTGSSGTSSGSGDKSGQGTYYDTGLGACGITNKDSDYIVAISHYVFEPETPNGNPNNNPLCGRKIRAYYEGKSVDVTVQDQCMGCKAGDLDFSPTAFKQIADIDLGRIDITWEWL